MPLPDLLQRSLETGRIHSAYLIAGPGDAPREAAARFVRALVCTGAAPPCEACRDCRRSAEITDPERAVTLDGAGKRGPLYRHVGDHADLLWVERGPDDTRVRIGQIRAVQAALRLRSGEGGRRACVVADAEWLNQEAQNALLRLLEEPPPETSLVLVAASASGLLATVRSRCQRVVFPLAEPDLRDPDAAEPVRALVARLDAAADLDVPGVLDWAEEYRGARAVAAEGVETLLSLGAAWLQERTRLAVRGGETDVDPALEAFAVLSRCRQALAQRNANPQMVAERALLAIRDAAVRAP